MTTQSNKKPARDEPSAGAVPSIISDTELREAIRDIMVLDRNKTGMGRSQSINGLFALVQAREQQLLTELLDSRLKYTDLWGDGHGADTIEAVPVSVIEHKRESL